MPKNKLNDNRDDGVGVGDVPDTSAVTGDDRAGSALPPGAPDTPAVGALWAALSGHAGGTNAELAEAAMISRSSAAKALAALEEAGLASRTKGGRQGARLLPDRWQVTAAVEPTAHEPADVIEALPAEPPSVLADAEPSSDAAPEQDDSRSEVAEATAGTGEAPDASVTVKAESARLRPGALREMVIGYLREHPDEDLSPSALGRALARSSGALANACDRLLADGVITQTSDKPRRYRAAKSAD